MIRAMIKTLLGTLDSPEATIEELRTALANAEAEIGTARAAKAAADEAYAASLVRAEPAALKKLADEQTTARIRIDQAEAIRSELAAKLAAAEESAAEAERVARYEAARTQADEARGALREFYPQLAADLVRLIEGIAEAELAVQVANRDLPKGVEALASVEGAVRNIPALPEDVVSEIEVERWVEVGAVKPTQVPDSRIARTDQPGWGYYTAGGNASGGGYASSQLIHVERRTFTEKRFRPPTILTWSEELARTLVLPGLVAGEPSIWSPPDGRDPGPADVLAHLAALRNERPTGTERKIETAYIPTNPQPVEAPRREKDLADRIADIRGGPNRRPGSDAPDMLRVDRDPGDYSVAISDGAR